MKHKQNKLLGVEAPWACSWIASHTDKLYLALKKTHAAFLVISAWFGERLSLAAALRSAIDGFSEELRIMGTAVYYGSESHQRLDLQGKKIHLNPTFDAVK